MRKFLYLFMPFFFLELYAQDTSLSKMEVKYLVTCISDTVENELLTDTFCLRFNDTISLFYEQHRFEMDSLKANDVAKWSRIMSNALSQPSDKKKGNAKYYVLTDYKQGTYTYQDNISGGIYRYTDSLPSFHWQILPEFKVMCNYQCQKAIGRYMGRQYEVWFANGLSHIASPWKFYGLPGLVMEAYDTQHQYGFKFLDIYPCSGEIAMFPTKHFKSTKTKFLQELSTYLANPVSYRENNAPVRIHIRGNSQNELNTELRNNCRHLPLELLE